MAAEEPCRHAARARQADFALARFDDVGRFTVIRDPQGAVINAITYKKM